MLKACAPLGQPPALHRGRHSREGHDPLGKWVYGSLRSAWAQGVQETNGNRLKRLTETPRFDHTKLDTAPPIAKLQIDNDQPGNSVKRVAVVQGYPFLRWPPQMNLRCPQISQRPTAMMGRAPQPQHPSDSLTKPGLHRATCLSTAKTLPGVG